MLIVRVSKEKRHFSHYSDWTMGLSDRENEVRFLIRADICLIFTSYRPSLALRTIPDPVSIMEVFHGAKRLGGEADKSPPFNDDVRNVWSYTSTLHV